MFLRSNILILIVSALLFSCSADEGGGTPGSSTVGTVGGAGDVADVAVKAAPKDELSLLCPEGALAFIRFNDLLHVEQEVHDLARTVDPDGGSAVFLTEEIGKVLLNPTMQGVDLTRPLGIAIFNGEMSGPVPVFVIPVSSAKEFKQVVESDPNWPRMQQAVGLSFLGKWAVFAMDPAIIDVFELRKDPVPLAAQMLAGDVSLAVDLVAINELVAPELAKLEDKPADTLPGMEMYEGMLKGMLEGLKSFLSDSEILNYAVTMKDGDVSLTVRYGARPGSETGEMLAKATPQKPELIHSLGTTGLFAAEFYMSMEKLWDIYAPMYEAMFADDEELLAFMKKGFTLADGGAVGMSIRNGMKMVGLTHLADPEGYQEYYAEMMSRISEFKAAMENAPGMEEMPFTFEMLPGWKHGDVDVMAMKIGMDFSGIPNMPPQMSMFMDQFFGPDGMTIQTCKVGELGISTIGDEDIKAVIDRLKAGETTAMSAVYAEATSGFPETVNGIFYLNLGEMAPWIGDLAKDDLKPAQQALLRNPPPDLWCAGYARTEGPTLTFGMNLKLGQMFKYVSAIMQSK